MSEHNLTGPFKDEERRLKAKSTEEERIKLETDSFGRNESIIVKNGEKYTGLFTPIKFCYRFLGWYTEKVGGTLITQDSIVDITKVDTLYATFQDFSNEVLSSDLVKMFLDVVTDLLEGLTNIIDTDSFIIKKELLYLL